MMGKCSKRLVAFASLIFLLFYSFAAPVLADSTKSTTGSISFPDYDSGKGVDLKKSQAIELKADGVSMTSSTAEKAIVILVDSTLQQQKEPDTVNPFDYALFSTSDESTLNFQGKDISLIGKIHSNGYLKANYGDIDFIDTTESGIIVRSSCESVKGLVSSDIRGEDESRFTTAPPRAPVDKADEILINSKKVPDGCKDIYIDDDHKSEKTYYTNYQRKDKPGQNLMINQPNNTQINVDSVNKNKLDISWQDFVINNATYYFHSDVQFDTSVIVKGKSYIICDGDIDFYGDNINTNDGNLTIYSTKKDGHVIIHNEKTKDFNGIIYAPDSSFSMKGMDVTINGTVIAKTIDSYPSKLTLHFKPNDYEKKNDPVFNKKFSASDAIKTFMNTFSLPKVSTLMGIWTYSDKVHGAKFDGATEESFDLLNVNDSASRTKLNNIVNNIDNVDNTVKQTVVNDSNLGDGLRKAYYALNSKSIPKNIPKYVVVLSATVPNARTVLIGKEDNMFFGAGIAEASGTNSKIIHDYGVGVDDTNYELYYAQDYGTASTPGYVTNCITRDKWFTDITPIFVNCVPDNGAVDDAMEKVGKVYYDWANPKGYLPTDSKGNPILLGEMNGVPGQSHHLLGDGPTNLGDKLSEISTKIYADKRNKVPIPVKGITLNFKVPEFSIGNSFGVNVSAYPEGTTYNTGTRTIKELDGTTSIPGDFRLDYSETDELYHIMKKDGANVYKEFKIEGISVNFVPSDSIDGKQDKFEEEVEFSPGDICTATVNTEYYAYSDTSTNEDKSNVSVTVKFKSAKIKAVYNKDIQ